MDGNVCSAILLEFTLHITYATSGSSLSDWLLLTLNLQLVLVNILVLNVRFLPNRTCMPTFFGKCLQSEPNRPKRKHLGGCLKMFFFITAEHERSQWKSRSCTTQKSECLSLGAEQFLLLLILAVYVIIPGFSNRRLQKRYSHMEANKWQLGCGSKAAGRTHRLCGGYTVVT